MKGPYENVLLGAFIFRLGYKMGESGKLKNTPFAASLFQQTPLDAVFSDFMCASKAKGFLLEFKKNWEGRILERAKEKYKLLQEQPTLAAQAEKCHLLGYGKDIEHSQGQGDIDILFGSYLEIVSAEREEELKVWSLSNFLQEIIDEKIGAHAEEFRDYINNFLKHLEEHHRANTSSRHLFANKKLSALGSATGAVAIMNTGNALYAMPISSIIDLGVNLKISLAEELSKKIEPPSHDEHSRGIDMEKVFHGIDMEKYTQGFDWDEYMHRGETEQHSRGIDMDRDSRVCFDVKCELSRLGPITGSNWAVLNYTYNRFIRPWLNNRPIRQQDDKEHISHWFFNSVRKANKPESNRRCPNLLSLQCADLYVIKSRHEVCGNLNRFLFGYGVGRILFTGLKNVLKCSAVLWSIYRKEYGRRHYCFISFNDS